MRLAAAFALAGQPRVLVRLGEARRSAAAAPVSTTYVANGTFPGNDITGWTFQSGMSVGSEMLNVANATGVGRAATYTFPGALPVSGSSYAVTFDVSNWAAAGAGISIQLRGGTILAGQPVTGNGSYSFTVVAGSGTSTLKITFSNNSTYSVDNVQVSG